MTPKPKAEETVPVDWSKLQYACSHDCGKRDECLREKCLLIDRKGKAEETLKALIERVRILVADWEQEKIGDVMDDDASKLQTALVDYDYNNRRTPAKDEGEKGCDNCGVLSAEGCSRVQYKCPDWRPDVNPTAPADEGEKELPSTPCTLWNEAVCGGVPCLVLDGYSGRCRSVNNTIAIIKEQRDEALAENATLQAALAEKEKEVVDKTTDFSDAVADTLRLKKQVEKLETEAKEYDAGFKRIVDNDRAKDEVHCGCCVELRLQVEKDKKRIEELEGGPTLQMARSMLKSTKMLQDFILGVKSGERVLYAGLGYYVQSANSSAEREAKLKSAAAVVEAARAVYDADDFITDGGEESIARDEALGAALSAHDKGKQEPEEQHYIKEGLTDA